MARINIEDALFKDNRFINLAIRLGSRRAALGALTEAWIVAQQTWLPARLGIPKTRWEREGLEQAILDVGLAEIRDDHVYMAGSEAQFAWLERNSDAGKRGGPAAAKARRVNKGKSNRPKASTGDLPRALTLSPSLSPSLSLAQAQSQEEKKIAQGFSEAPAPANKPSVISAIWEAYREAYKRRWGEAPPWNARIAGQLKNFSARVSNSEAPAIAAFYLTHTAQRYVAAMHPVGMLLQDAEKLRTEWVTGNRMTASQARTEEHRDANTQAMRDYLARKGQSR